MVAGPIISYTLILVIGVQPWYDAQYLIPMLGMILGNACSGVAVGLSSVLEELSSGKDKVEQLLALGATRLEATHAVIKQAARLALTPLLNSMNVVGIVSIPGMMTGQILGGNDPSTAAKYQIIIIYIIGAATGMASVITIFGAVLTVVDGKHRLHSEKLHHRDDGSGASGAVGWIVARVVGGGRYIKKKVKRVWNRLFGRSSSRSSGGYSALGGGPSGFGLSPRSGGGSGTRRSPGSSSGSRRNGGGRRFGNFSPPQQDQSTNERSSSPGPSSGGGSSGRKSRLPPGVKPLQFNTGGTPSSSQTDLREVVVTQGDGGGLQEPLLGNR